MVVAFALMMLAKVDTILVERARTHMTDAIAPILDVMPYFEDLRPTGPPVRQVSDRRSL